MTTKKKPQKVKIESHEIKMFAYETLEIDPYWDNLYNPDKYKNKPKYKK